MSKHCQMLKTLKLQGFAFAVSVVALSQLRLPQLVGTL
jgi:hypothetical protein